jgi:hypothetical protein
LRIEAEGIGAEDGFRFTDELPLNKVPGIEVTDMYKFRRLYAFPGFLQYVKIRQGLLQQSQDPAAPALHHP